MYDFVRLADEWDMLVLKQVHPDTGISNKAMAILNSFVNDIFERIAGEASSAYFEADVSRAVAHVPCRTRVVLEKVDHLVARDSNECAVDLARRTLQARHLGGNQVGDQGVFYRCALLCLY